MLLILFLLCLLAAAYPVVVYPLLALGLARLRPRPWKVGTVTAPIVHIITVYNEERRIAAKLENSLAVIPPPGGLRTVVADDGSTDGTKAIVERYASRGVIWVECPRRGKEHAQLEAMRRTTEDPVVFSDASTMLEPDAIENLIRPFVDDTIGAVSGTDRISGDGAGTGEDIYVRYEMATRRAESLIGSLVGVSGCLFAARREIMAGLVPVVTSDMGAALLAIRAGKRAVAQDDAVCTYGTTPRMASEFSRKRRTALRGLVCMRTFPVPLRWGNLLVFWQFVSHKVLRFLIPVFSLAAMLLAVLGALEDQLWAIVVVAAASVVATVGLLGAWVPALRQIGVLKTISFGLVSVIAVLAAWADLLRGRDQAAWTPTTRPEVET